MDLNTPAAEIDIDAALISQLVGAQAASIGEVPLASLPIEIVASGWDNVIARLGDEWSVRLPRRAMAAPLVVNEQRWLPTLAERLPLPIPVPLFAGRPQGRYPWHWSIGRWLPGVNAEVSPPTDLDAAARALGDFVRALHVPAPADAPRNPFRGQHLAQRVALMEQRFTQLGELVPVAAVELWHELRSTPAWAGAPTWLHGDLHPANLLVADGRLSAVIDFGDITSGDPATDLAVAWMLFDGPRRAAFLKFTGCDEDTVRRAAAWAISLACAYLTSSNDNPLIAGIGARTLGAVIEHFA